MTTEQVKAKPSFKRLAEVTVAQLKVQSNTEYYVKFAGSIHLGQQLADKVSVDPKTGEITTETPKRAHVAYVMDLEVMAPRMIVVSSVMVSELERGYPNDGYVGKCFGFKSLGKLNGKGYNTIEIWEIEPPANIPEMRVADGILKGQDAAPAPEATKTEEIAATTTPAPVAKPKK